MTTIPGSVCSSLVSNPTYTPTAALPRNYTWGCPPGYLCQPPHTGDRASCGIEAGLPDPGYICASSECILAPPLDVYQSGPYNISKNYYNLNPEDFGLNYSILQISEDSYPTSKKRDIFLREFVGGRKMKRVDITDIPAVCWNDCDGAADEPQKIGKTPELCETDSAFMENLAICEGCVTNNAESGSDKYSSKLLPTFAQWLNFCSDMVSSTTDSGATSTQVLTTVTITEAQSTSLVSISSTGASTRATITSTQATNTEEARTAEATTEEVPTKEASTENQDTQSTEDTDTSTETDVKSSSAETTRPGSFITTPTSESVPMTSLSRSIWTTSLSGSVLITSVSGSVITTSSPGSIRAVSSAPGMEAGDEDTYGGTLGNIGKSSLSRFHGSPTGSGYPSSSSPIFNAATSRYTPNVGIIGFVWAIVTTMWWNV